MPLRRHRARRSFAASLGGFVDLPFGAYEKHVLRSYALTVLRPDRGKSKLEITDELIEWYKSHRRLLGFRVGPIDSWIREAESARRSSFGNTLRFTPGNLPELTESAPKASAFQSRVDWIGRTLNLEPAEVSLLGAVARLTQVPRFRELIGAASGCMRDDDEVPIKNAAHMAGLSERDTQLLGTCRTALFQLGLLEDRGGFDVALSAPVTAILASRTTSEEAMRRSLFGELTPSSLDMSDFNHLGSARELFLSLLDGALQKKVSGASFLFHGEPGTGKTEFARAVAAELEAQVVFIGEVGSDRRGPHRMAEPTRADRLAHLAFASALAKQAGRTILVIDEADDIFTGVDDEKYSNRTGSKVFMNRVVETCPVPMIWITNHPDRMGPAVLRRMLTAVEFREAEMTTRRRIVERHARAHDVAFADHDIAALAALPASPALLQAGIRAASLVGHNEAAPGEAAVAVTRSLLRVAGRDRPALAIPGPIGFDASLSNADQDLAEIERRVALAGPGPLSFLFSGLPGTGKSAFARHLATRLGMEVLEKRASDLLGMFVGESEKRIADAFHEAADTKRFLIFDEADSLLGDRSGARHGWEVSQVNEMLTWMESHPLPFAATTNLAVRLDPAVQRRFLFKVRFEALTPTQIASTFERVFGTSAPTSVERLHPMTQGDFSIVARKAKIMREGCPVQIGRMLASEVEAKSVGCGRIGF
ncbi:AAA family ATPase [Aureimonas sp. AU22]|uniref:AAA family ATPase n=1 Tax=Aureimonas sp. AU22 TaxID=1638162 RepID=UPI000781B484|nr:ATP-binding protein [Aureimonas sp. AU22]